MRTQVTWTINNQSGQKLFYGLYKDNDDVCRIVLDSMYGEMESGHSIDTDVPQSRLKIRFWKSMPTMGLGGDAYTDGILVNTNASVTISGNGKVTQGKADEFSNKPAGQVTFLEASAGTMSDSDIVRAVFLLAAGKIPYVGGAVEKVLGLIWPEDHQSPEELMKKSEERMKRWVQGLIDQYDLGTMKQELAGLRRSIAEYHETKNPPDRPGRLDGCIRRINAIIDHFTKTNYTPGSLSFVLELAMIHLTLLRERVMFTKEIYGSDVDKPLYLKQLGAAIAEYQGFVAKTGIPGELAWRQRQIKTEPMIGRGNAIYGWSLKDYVTRDCHKFSLSGRSQLNQGPAEVCVNFYKSQANNTFERELQAAALDASLLWSRVLPGHENDQPIALDRIVWTGPYAGLSYMEGNEHNFNIGDIHEQSGRRLTRIKIRAADRIDALRFDFDDRDGRWFGNTSGGTEHTIDLPAGVFVTSIETWWDFDLFAIGFRLSDGRRFDYGKSDRGSVHQIAAYPEHAVRGIKLADRMHELHVGFGPLPDYYQRIAAKPA
ncbi:insecticidal delta-endotoxin Cry8Ea1 family protein [Tahibacter sp. UC22_41]|uniref:insecticidal delta-endotoxin Cry8Ea1 family protein n=1 Tax=Tahibacter sp. UC22_41 TaxID=3350178 RepID=UPI0036DF4622